MQNLVAVSHAVCAHVGGPNNLGRRPAPPKLRRVADLIHAPLPAHTFYRIKFGRGRSDRVGVGERLKIWGMLVPRPLGMWDVSVSVSLETRSLLPQVLPLQIWSF